MVVMAIVLDSLTRVQLLYHLIELNIASKVFLFWYDNDMIPSVPIRFWEYFDALFDRRLSCRHF